MVFATLSGVKPIVVEQIYGPKVLFYYQLKSNKIMHSKNATLIHAWGPVMTISMGKANVDMDKVLVLPKGIDLSKFHNQNTADPEKIHAIVTRSLSPEYRHAIILNSFNLLHQKELTSPTIVGEQSLLP
jgi:hypothetical protein